ncbi:unnamed protein product [Cunninghamella blakesleeana]
MFRRKTTIKKTTVTLPLRNQYVLDTYTRRMKRYEELVYVCCFWVGYDLLLELIPVVGKCISLLFSLSMFRLACKADLPRRIRKKMIYHITVDFLLGLIPILGIILNMLYRAHSKNTKILKKYLYERAVQNEERAKITEQTTYESIQEISANDSQSSSAPLITQETQIVSTVNVQYEDSKMK